MSPFSVQLVPAVGGEDSIWMQMLVFVVLVGLWGLYNLIKTKDSKYQSEENEPEYTYSNQGRRRWQIRTLSELKEERVGIVRRIKAGRPKEESLFDFNKTFINRERGRDLSSGMEILETKFLLGVIEKRENADANDVIMCKLSFNELIRRGGLSVMKSDVLKFYAKDVKRLYGKDIQCAAMQGLGRRTEVSSGGDIITVQKKSKVRKRAGEKVIYEKEEVLSRGR